MQRHQLRTDMHCVSTQSPMRPCVSQDSHGTAARLCGRTSPAVANAAQHDPKSAVFLPASQRNSFNPTCTQDTGGSAHPSYSAFDKCTSADSTPGSPDNNVESGQSLGVVGQAMIVTSRIEGYCRAVWGLLRRCAEENDEGTCLEQQSPELSPFSCSTAQASPAPLLKFLAAVRLLVQHLILLRIQALHISAAANESDARSLLQHVLLWQHLRHNSVMELIALAVQQGAGSPPATGRGSNAAHGSFLMSTGVPLVQQAIAQVHGSLVLCTAADGTNPATEVVLDMMGILRMIHAASTSAPSQSLDCNIDALSQDAESLHRAVAFISSNTAFVAYLLSASQGNRPPGTSQDSQQTFATLAYTSALLGNTSHASIRYSEVAGVATARMAVSRYSASAAQLYRAAKAAILDARIQTTCGTTAPTPVARAKISTAVSKAFRTIYLFPELKHLLTMWSSMLTGVVNDGLLPVDAVPGAEEAAAAAFDTTGDLLRFRVPSSGFLLIWSTCPHSPARNLVSLESSPRTASCSALSDGHKHQHACARSTGSLLSRQGPASLVGMKRGTSEIISGAPVQHPHQHIRAHAASDSALVELASVPQMGIGSRPCTHVTSGDSGGSNGSDHTNMTGPSPGSDSGGSGSAAAATAAARHDNVFAVPPPRPVRGLSSEIPEALSVPPLCGAGNTQQLSAPQAALRAAAVASVSERPLQVLGLAPLRGRNIPLECLPGNLSALAAAAVLR